MTTDSPMTEYVSLQDYAARYSLSTKTVRRRIAAGLLPAIRVGTGARGMIRIPVQAAIGSPVV